MGYESRGLVMDNESGRGAGAPVARRANGTILPGQKLARGRKGSRNLLSQAFYKDLHADWLKHGRKVIELVREKHPDVYAKMVAHLMPRLIEYDASITSTNLNVGIDQRMISFEEAYRIVGSKPPPMIEARIDEEQAEGQAED
jgi:hypothetical protein